MKWLRFKILFFITCFSILSVRGQSKYDNRIAHYHGFWNKLIPSYAKAQFAGSMGLISVGPGWEYGKHHWETDVLWGYLPKFDSDKNKITFTLKQNYIPWKKSLNRHFSVDPLTASFYFNTILSDDYWVKEPNKYPNGYYGFSTRIRMNIALGQRVTYLIPKSKRKFIKSITAFYELGTTDFYIVSAATNKYLKPENIIHLSLGVKAQFF